MKFLLDTNVISELWKPRPSAPVLAWLAANEGEYLIAAPALAEIADGAASAPSPKRERLLDRLHELLEDHADHIAPFDAAAALAWGRARHSPEVKRRPQPLFDTLIEAIAAARGLTVATRNTADFRAVETVNPWD